MREALRRLFAIALLVIADLVSLTGASAAEVPVASSTQAADAWAGLAQDMVSDADMRRTSETLLDTLVRQLSQDPDFTKMEQEFPGMIAAFRDALRPLMMEELDRITPKYRADIAALYRAHITSDEATEVAAFLRSPPMQRFKASLVQSLDLDTSVRDLGGTGEISKEAMAADLRRTALQASLTTDGADLAKINAFFATPTGAKFAALNPQKREIDRKWSNYISPEAQAKIEPIVIDAMVAHVAMTDPKFAEDLRNEIARQKPHHAGQD